ncbi:uncharacterized protein LOC114265228 [Camellia sinensis]|uniref:uncharacterized protein LOC114265228 n=1 Tax=Camellia sinensis TaxID=4442 RepID=UPI0010361067|nr:uncharacterized protein LOC114265228 [Camellia sinensis]
MGRKKAVADDLLADIPNIVTVQSSPSQSQPKPKPKRLKKTQAKATANAARKAQDEAREKAGVAEVIAKVLEAEKKKAEAKTAKAQAELIVVLATKDAEIKAADKKAYTKGAADVREDCKKQDEGDKVSKEDASYRKTISDAPIVEKNIDQTLEEIDAELAAEKAAEKSSHMSSKNQTLPADDAE